MDPYQKFKQECLNEIDAMGRDEELHEKTRQWRLATRKYKYPYHFEWVGRPIIQQPQDIVAMQEIIWETRPDLIIETGIAHGGSLVLSASMLALLDMADAAAEGNWINPTESGRKALGIDIDIRSHNREAIEAHPMCSRIQMIEGSSTDMDVIEKVHDIASNYDRILVCLDSMHTHDHVLAELEAYAPLVSRGSYCVVFDTVIEDMPDDMFPDRPWGRGNNPKTAVHLYLKNLEKEGRKGRDGEPLRFEINKNIEHKLLITVAPDGYLRRR